LSHAAQVFVRLRLLWRFKSDKRGQADNPILSKRLKDAAAGLCDIMGLNVQGKEVG